MRISRSGLRPTPSNRGFESGGVAAAHAFAQAFTTVPKAKVQRLHGEMVAMGTLTQLVLEGRPDEARRAGSFFAGIGLPVHLEQLCIDPASQRDLDAIVGEALAFPFLSNMPMALDAQTLREGLLAAHELVEER